MSLLDVARTRYTTKHYDPAKRVSDADFADLLEVLRLAPTSVNAQATRYFVADNAAAKEKILPAILDFNRPRVTESSHTIVFAVKDPITDADFEVPNAGAKAVQDQGRRYFAGVFAKAPGGSYAWTARQSYIAMGFLLAAAAEKGIDSTPIEGLDTAKLDEILGLREKGMRSVAVVTLGYRSPNDGNAQRPKSRLALDRIVTRL